MEDIAIESEERFENGWIFVVSVGYMGDKIEYTVILDEDYWRDLTDRREEPGQLVRRSFGFLLSRESKDVILKKFNLRAVNTYFPEFEEEISKKR